MPRSRNTVCRAALKWLCSSARYNTLYEEPASNGAIGSMTGSPGRSGGQYASLADLVHRFSGGMEIEAEFETAP